MALFVAVFLIYKPHVRRCQPQAGCRHSSKSGGEPREIILAFMTEILILGVIGGLSAV